MSTIFLMFIVTLSVFAVFCEACSSIRGMERERDKIRHKQCLLNIARLEREIWPERFKGSKIEKLWTDEYAYGPGQIWAVNDPRDLIVELRSIPGKSGPG